MAVGAWGVEAKQKHACWLFLILIVFIIFFFTSIRPLPPSSPCSTVEIAPPPQSRLERATWWKVFFLVLVLHNTQSHRTNRVKSFYIKVVGISLSKHTQWKNKKVVFGVKLKVTPSQKLWIWTVDKGKVEKVHTIEYEELITKSICFRARPRDIFVLIAHTHTHVVRLIYSFYLDSIWFNFVSSSSIDFIYQVLKWSQSRDQRLPF